MDVCTRVIYDNDGEIVAILWEMTGDVMARKQDVTLHYIDIEHGSIDFSTMQILGVDVETQELVYARIDVEETPEQKRIKELEALLRQQAADE